jgi:hypothetical protein
MIWNELALKWEREDKAFMEKEMVQRLKQIKMTRHTNRMK